MFKANTSSIDQCSTPEHRISQSLNHPTFRIPVKYTIQFAYSLDAGWTEHSLATRGNASTLPRVLLPYPTASNTDYPPTILGS